jgi:hypothetical protein
MEQIKQVFSIWNDGLDSPNEIIFFILTLLLITYPLLVKLIKIISFNDFDRLLMPKDQRSLQQKIVKIIDYFTFSIFYFLYGIIFSEFFVGIDVSYVVFLIFIFLVFIFVFTLFPIILISALTEIFKGKNSKIIIWISKIHRNKSLKYIFIFNVISGILIYSVLFHFFKFNYLVNPVNVLGLVFPASMLYIYQSFRKKNNNEYICNIISEKEFNESLLIFFYILDKDRMVFRKPDDKENKEIYIYDRISNKHFKFTRIKII